MNATELAAKVRDLAPASHTALKLITLLNRPANQNQEIVQLVKYDNVLTAKLLRACNSPAYGLEEPISSVEQAVMILGYLRLLRLTFAISFNGTMDKALPGYAAQAGEIWRHSLITAFAAESLARLDSPAAVPPAVAFTAGLLHDIGKLVLNDALDAATLSAIRSHLVKSQTPCWQAEQAVLGTDHAEVGGRLLQNWNLPAGIVEAVSHHHQPPCQPAPKLSALVHVADCLAHLENPHFAWDTFAAATAPEVLAALQLTPEKMNGFSATLTESMAQAGQLMKLS